MSAIFNLALARALQSVVRRREDAPDDTPVRVRSNADGSLYVVSSTGVYTAHADGSIEIPPRMFDWQKLVVGANITEQLA